MQWGHWLRRGALALLLLLVGCKPPCGESCYGVPVSELLPAVTLDSFSYEPVTGLRVGDIVVFRATCTPAGTALDGVLVSTGQPAETAVIQDGLLMLYDNGVAPDTVAGDGVFTGQTELRQSCTGVPVRAQFWDEVLVGDPLNVLPGEEQQ